MQYSSLYCDLQVGCQAVLIACPLDKNHMTWCTVEYFHHIVLLCGV